MGWFNYVVQPDYTTPLDAISTTPGALHLVVQIFQIPLAISRLGSIAISNTVAFFPMGNAYRISPVEGVMIENGK
ncbi:MAG: hypothetical protein AAGU17_03475 [Anaerolineaceae bacterium]